MSEYLDRLKHLRDSKTPVGETAAVQTNVSFRRAIDHIEKLELQEAYLLARLKEADERNGQQRRKHDEQRGTDKHAICNIINKYYTGTS